MNEKPMIVARKRPLRGRQVLLTGGIRNEHGTRISRKVVCEKCKSVDYVAVSRKKDESLLCRNCAKKEIGAFEVGTRVDPEMMQAKCSNCKKDFEIPAWIQKEDPVFCSDCFSGFEVWRGSLNRPPEERTSYALSRRRSGTLLRTRRQLSAD